MKKIYNYKFYYFAISILIMQSCGTYFYYPTQHNVLEFSKKSDLQSSLVVGEHETTASLGYALTNYFAYNITYRNFEGSFDISRLNPKSTNLFEHELIFFKKTKHNFIGACNVGLGNGYIANGFNEISFNRTFIQPSFGYKGNFFDFAVSTRFSKIDYRESRNYYGLSKNSFYFIEPAYTIGLGYKNVKFRFQKVQLKQSSNYTIPYIHQAINISLNITCNIENIHNKISKNK